MMPTAPLVLRGGPTATAGANRSARWGPTTLGSTRQLAGLCTVAAAPRTVMTCGRRMSMCMASARLPVASFGSSSQRSQASTLCAAAGVLHAPHGAASAFDVTPGAVGEALLRRWLGVGEDVDLPTVQESSPVRETACDITMVATVLEVKGRRHALIAAVLHNSGGSGPSVDELRNPVLHWGCVGGHGKGWSTPPPGWSSWPKNSHDARGGAWQTPFTEQHLPGLGSVRTLTLQLPYNGPLSTGGLAYLIKAGSKWMGDASSKSDFYLPTAAGLPGVLASDLSSALAPGNDGLEHGPTELLDMEKLAIAPKVPKQQQHHGHGHGGEPDLPNAGRREREPQHDDTQVCTLSADQLHDVAAGQLAAWVSQQHDLELPLDGLDIHKHEFPVRGHPNTPFVMATTALWRARPGGGREAVLLVAALGDVGLTGRRVQGLVFHWSAVDADGAAAILADPAAAGSVAVDELPDGWRTQPELGWDAGSGFWDTPMTRTLYKVPHMAPGGLIARPASPEDSEGDMYLTLMRLPLVEPFSSGGLVFTMRTARRQWVRHDYTGGPFFLDTSELAEGMARQLMARTPTLGHANGHANGYANGHANGYANGYANGHTLHEHDDTTSAAAMDEQVMRLEGLLVDHQQEQEYYAADEENEQAANSGGHAAPGSRFAAYYANDDASTTSSSRGAGDADADAASWAATRGALAAAGLSEDDIATYAGDMPAAGPGLSVGGQSPTYLAAALDTADAELSAHILSQSSLSAQPAAPQLSAVERFIRDFEPGALDLNAIQWGMAGEGGHGEPGETHELGSHPWLMHHIAELEHNAQRSLMHRYGIAADLVQDLLPALRDAAAHSPESLAWPPGLGGHHHHHYDHDAYGRGRVALAGLVAVTVWLRLSALRLLTWNRNYNVKPREISAALDRLGAGLIEVYEAAPQLRGVVLLALSSAGRGGEGDMGQRIRDEILAIQQRNGCKGGMMEEWHQKLHNNSSPDDLVICEALLDYLAADQDINVYWRTLAAEGITRERLASYDRPIVSEPPRFKPEQVHGLTEDLIAYRRTLAAVHSGADLAAAIDGVLGYDAGECKGKHVKVEPLHAVLTPELRHLLGAILSMVQDGDSSSAAAHAADPNSKVAAMLDVERALKLQGMVVAARELLSGPMRGGNAACHGRLRDVLFLDLALERTAKTSLESSLTAVRSAASSTMLGGLLSLLQQPLANAVLSAMPGQGGNASLLSVLRQLQHLTQECPGLDTSAKARHVIALIERLRSQLAGSASSAIGLLQPTAGALGSTLQVDGHWDALGPVGLLAEEVVRGSAAAALSLLLSAIEPSLRRLAGVSAWQVISRLPSHVTGTLSHHVPCLSQLPYDAIAPDGRTILVLGRLAGEEEVPPGVAAVVVLGDCPDILSHAAVRARNCRVPVVACPSSEASQVSHVRSLAGRDVTLSIVGDEVHLLEGVLPAPGEPLTSFGDSPVSSGSSYGGSQDDAEAEREAAAAAAASAWAAAAAAGPVWDGERWVLPAGHFAPGAVGAKAMSVARLAAATEGGPNGVRLPAWLSVPPAVALPHGAFEAALQAPLNRDLAGQLAAQLDGLVAEVDASGGACVPAGKLEYVRGLVSSLRVPPGLQHELRSALAPLAEAAGGSGYNWDGVWEAIKGVWASQWNERAVTALAKARLPLGELRMGVLLQPLLPARYSWVAHTVNPATGSRDEIVVQLVVGLGESLVANHTGRPLGGVIRRESLEAALDEALGREPAAWQQHGSSNGYDEYDTGISSAHASTEEEMLFPGGLTQLEAERQQHSTGGGGRFGAFFQRLGGHASGHGPVRREAISSSRVRSSGGGGRFAAYLDSVGRGGAARSGAAASSTPPTPARGELLAAVDVASFPSKEAAVVPAGMVLPGHGGGRGGEYGNITFMARSDSNAEDLPGFAGAGLFDTLPSAPHQSVLLDYTAEPMLWDKEAAAALLWQCALAALAAEEAMEAAGCGAGGVGMDVEGAVTEDGGVWLLQARPQV